MPGLRTKQNSISFKVWLGFGTTAIVLITALLMTIYQINSVNRLIDQISTSELPAIKAVNNLTIQVNKTINVQRNWLVTNNANLINERHSIWDNDIKQTLAQMQELTKANTTSMQEFQLLQRDLTTLKNKQDEIETTTGLSNQELQSKFLRDIGPIVQNLRTDATIYQNDHESQLVGNLQQMQTGLTTVFFVAGSFLFLGIILCGLMALILSRSITRPIYRLVSSTKQLATGDLTQDFTIIGALEFEELSQSLNNVVTTLRNIADVTETMAMGDYSKRVDIKSEQDQLAISVNQMLDNFAQIVNQANAIANGDYSTDIIPRSSMDKLGTSLQNMTETLRQNKLFTDDQNWLKDGLGNFANIVGETRDLPTLCNQVISEVCRYTNAGCGTLYVYTEESGILQLFGSYAYMERSALHNQFKLGEGIAGQVGLEKKPIILKKTSDVIISSGTIEEPAETVYCAPIIYEKSLIGVIELAWNHGIQDLIIQYFDSIAPMLASHMQAAYQQKITEQLLHEQKLLAEKLQIQQEELKATNEELEQQAQTLRASEEELRAKDETQRAINAKLEEKTRELVEQKEQVEQTNYALKQASDELKQKAEELSLASKYKSEFLANMSHELRTPLNSLIILAKLFAENKESNLNEDQIESAKIMLKSGNDLLTLINDILDLAKVEAGKIEIHLGQARLSDFIDSTNRNFKHVTDEKHIDLIAEIASGLPELIITDEQRVSQVVRNLLSNAIKFTENGYVKLLIERPKANEIANLPTNKQYLAFRVIDTGIGIPKDKQALVFEAFQQADGTTSRKYGGTGLGLSISTQFAKLLNGSLSLTSEDGKGSQFTLIIPDNTDLLGDDAIKEDVVINTPKPALAVANTTPTLISKRELPKLLLVSNEPQQLELFNKLVANQYSIVHLTHSEEILQHIQNNHVAGIVIDLDLDTVNGLELINKLKENPTTTNIPLMVFGSLDVSPESITRSVIGYVKKPINEQSLTKALAQIQESTNSAIRSLLIVEDDLNHLNAIKKLLARNNLTIETAATGTEALYKLTHSEFDCVVLDLGLPDISGQEMLKQYEKTGKKNYPAIIIYTGKDLSQEDSDALSGYVDSIILKGSMASMDRLQEETGAFLRKMNNQTQKTQSSDTQPTTNVKYSGEKILVVDDDMRNVYALSRVLKTSGFNVLMAANGKIAIETLEKNPDIKVVLMDIMMPVMDGYEAIPLIRQKPEFKDLPILALTAKAMLGDKEKCIEIGATDFLTKPIDIDYLLSMLQKWIPTAPQ